jgi:hypothetical protein
MFLLNRGSLGGEWIAYHIYSQITPSHSLTEPVMSQATSFACMDLNNIAWTSNWEHLRARTKWSRIATLRHQVWNQTGCRIGAAEGSKQQRKEDMAATLTERLVGLSCLYGLVRQVEKPVGFGWFNSVLWERISWNKLKQAETWPAEQDHRPLSSSSSTPFVWSFTVCLVIYYL